MGKIAPLKQITNLGYAWLKEQVGETLAFNYFSLYRKEKQNGLEKAYLFLLLLPFFLIEGIIFQILDDLRNPVDFWQGIWQFTWFFLAVSIITFLSLFFLYEKQDGFNVLGKLYFHAIVKEYDGWLVLLFFLFISGLLFYSSFFADPTMGKLFFLLGVLVLGLCFAFFRFIEWAYLRYNRLYDRLLWLNSQVENETFRKALEGLYGSRTEFRFNHVLHEISSIWIPDEFYENAVKKWKNEAESWYPRAWMAFTYNYLAIWIPSSMISDTMNLERLQKVILFVVVYFLFWVAQWVIRGKPEEIVTSFMVLFSLGGSLGASEFEMYSRLPIVHYFAILFAFIAVYLILRSRFMAQLIEYYKKKKGAQE